MIANNPVRRDGRVLVLAAVLAFLESPAAAHAGAEWPSMPSRPLGDATRDTPPRLPHTGPWNEILKIGERGVESTREVELNDPRPISGINIRVGHWPPLTTNDQLWILARGVDGPFNQCFGPAVWMEPGVVVVRDVRLLAGAGTGGGLFELHAFVVTQAAEQVTACADLTAKARDFSAPVRVRVAHQPLLEREGGIRIATIDGITPTLGEPAVVSGYSEISGLIAPGAGPFVYILVGVPGSDIWIADGPAEVYGQTWTLRNPQIESLSTESEKSRLLVAAAFPTRLPGTRLAYSVWRQRATAASLTLSVLIEASDVRTRVGIDSVSLHGQEAPLPLLDGAAVTVERIEHLATVRGRIQGAVSGRVWIVLASDGSGVVRVHGPATLVDDQWSFSGWSLRESGHLAGDKVRIYAVMSDAVPGESLVWEEDLLKKISARSNDAFLQLAHPLKPQEPGGLAISKVHDDKVRDGVPIPVHGGRLAGVADEPASGRHIQIRAALRGPGGWLLSDPVLLQGSTWAIPFFPALDSLAPGEIRELVVFGTEFPIAQDSLSTADLGRLPLALSPVVMVRHPSVVATSITEPQPAQSGTSWRAVLVTVLLSLLGLGLLVAIARRSTTMATTERITSDVSPPPFARMRESLRTVAASTIALYEKSRIFANRGAVLDSALGLFFMGVLALLIYCYLHIYQKVISTVLVMPKSTSLYLATALISFAALSGVLMEVSTKLLWPSDGTPWTKRIPRHGFALVIFVLMLACTLALCTVNTLIYASFYQRQAPAVALAFSAGSALMSVVEVVGFYCATNLGFGALVWLFLGVLRVPLALADAVVVLMRSLMGWIRDAFGPRPPSRPSSTKRPRADLPTRRPGRVSILAPRGHRPVNRRPGNPLKAVPVAKPDNHNGKIHNTHRR